MDLALENRDWKAFKISDIFYFKRGKRLKSKDRKIGQIAYYSATNTNNGLTDFVSNPLFVEEKRIIVSTFCDSYYVEGEFTASDEITMLTNQFINKHSGKFISRVITSNQSKYAFGRKAFSERLAKQLIILPINSKGEPDYEFMEQYVQHKEQEKQKEYQQFVQKKISQLKNTPKTVSLEEKEWKIFRISDVFIIKSGSHLLKKDMNQGNKPFVGATDSNNGVTAFVSNSNNSEDENVLGVNWNGSVVENFYHPYKAIFSGDVKKLKFKEFEGNKYLFLFVKAIILKQKEKYSYGYKFNAQRMAKQNILLPVSPKGEPDYEFMQNYMKNIELKKLTEYLKFKNG